MKTFKDLYIHLSDIAMESFIAKVALNVNKNDTWERQPDKENRVLGIEKTYSFSRLDDHAYPSAGLSIFPKKNGIWYVPNVVPIKYGNLSHDEYNGILSEFYNLFILPIATQDDIIVEITSGEISDCDILGEHAASLLKSFSLLANKSTGSSHPDDKDRWLSFVKASCLSGSNVDTDHLHRLLIEQGWSDEAANKLAIQYDFAKDLIEHIGK